MVICKCPFGYNGHVTDVAVGQRKQFYAGVGDLVGFLKYSRGSPLKLKLKSGGRKLGVKLAFSVTYLKKNRCSSVYTLLITAFGIGIIPTCVIRNIDFTILRSSISVQ